MKGIIQKLMGDGRQFGVNLQYRVQPSPETFIISNDNRITSKIKINPVYDLDFYE